MTNTSRHQSETVRPQGPGRIRNAGRAVVPPTDALAVVRLADPPDAVPRDLRSHVVRPPGAVDDWALDSDSVASDRRDIVRKYKLWRSSWERHWVLDPVPSLVRLGGLCAAMGFDSPIQDLGNRLTQDGDVFLSPRDQVPIVRDLEALGVRIRQRGAAGFGIVDRTPDTGRIGLVRCWPACGDDEVVAADAHTEVRFDPDIGLTVTSSIEGGEIVRLNIDDATASDDGFVVSGAGRSTLVPTPRARPLALIVPESTAWGVRRVPEIVCWARTFAGLESAGTFAIGAHLDLRITSRRSAHSLPDPSA